MQFPAGQQRRQLLACALALSGALAGCGGADEPGKSRPVDDRGWWTLTGGVAGLLLAVLLVALVRRGPGRRAG